MEPAASQSVWPQASVRALSEAHTPGEACCRVFLGEVSPPERLVLIMARCFGVVARSRVLDGVQTAGMSKTQGRTSVSHCICCAFCANQSLSLSLSLSRARARPREFIFSICPRFSKISLGWRQEEKQNDKRPPSENHRRDVGNTHCISCTYV